MIAMAFASYEMNQLYKKQHSPIISTLITCLLHISMLYILWSIFQINFHIHFYKVLLKSKLLLKCFRLLSCLVSVFLIMSLTQNKYTDISCIPIHYKVKVKSLSRVRLSATPWTAAHQAPPSMGFSRQEYCSGLPFPYPEMVNNLPTMWQI